MDSSKKHGPTIAFIGPNGAGKSTLARRLKEDLEGTGREVVLTREPGGSPGADMIRRLVLEGHADRWTPEVETLLFTAARIDHLVRTVYPALARGCVVISDRYLDDTRVFQGLQGEMVRERVEALVSLYAIPEAGISILVDVEPALAQQRLNARLGGGPDRFEQMGEQYVRDVREAFLVLARENSDRIVVIDGNQEPHVVYEEVRRVLTDRGIC